jgi:hypothetical protein
MQGDRVFDEYTTLIDVARELHAARQKFTPFHSAHEGLAVIEEEIEELREHVYTNLSRRDWPKMRREAIELAAMTVRFIEDICDLVTTGELIEMPDSESLSTEARNRPVEWVSPWPVSTPKPYTEPAPAYPPASEHCCKPAPNGGACSRRMGHTGTCSHFQDCGQIKKTACEREYGHAGECAPNPFAEIDDRG